jgi:hypothetical protein
MRERGTILSRSHTGKGANVSGAVPLARFQCETRVTVPCRTVLGFVWIIQIVPPSGSATMLKLGPGVNVSVPTQLSSREYCPAPPGGDCVIVPLC